MNDYREDARCCYFHPNEVVVGVCPLCLNERLLVLASKQSHLSSSKVHGGGARKPPITLPKIFAFGGSLLHRLELRHWRTETSDHEASTSQEDSFISIKIEDNGVASWEKGTVSKVSLQDCNLSWNHSAHRKESKSVIEHPKPRASLRWRKRIGHLFQLIRWKRSNKGTVCHVGGKVEGVKVRKSWVRTLTKKRTKE